MAQRLRCEPWIESHTWGERQLASEWFMWRVESSCKSRSTRSIERARACWAWVGVGFRVIIYRQLGSSAR